MISLYFLTLYAVDATFLKLGFTPQKTEQPLQGMKLKKIEFKDDQKEPKDKKCLLTTDLQPFTSQVKVKYSTGKKFHGLVG